MKGLTEELAPDLVLLTPSSPLLGPYSIVSLETVYLVFPPPKGTGGRREEKGMKAGREEAQGL